MASRRTGARSLPSTLESSKYSSKKDFTHSRRSLPECPSPNFWRYKTPMTGYRAKPRPVYFKNPITLDDTYDPNIDKSYLAQMFPTCVTIGEGSFGKVYRATSRNGEIYAIKKIRSTIKFNDRFSEIKNYEKLGEHPNIVQYYMAWEEAGNLFMKLEFCDISLAEFSTFCFNFPEEFLFRLLYDICSALSYMHKKQFIHLDVKPANLMTKNGFFKLADFGIMADINKKEIVKTLSEGDAKYVALEVLSGVYDPACDIFGLGITLIELCACIELPSQGLLWREIRNLVLPEEFNYNATLGLKTIVKQMLDPDYKKRPTANTILKYSTVKCVGKMDKKRGREDYYAIVKTQQDEESRLQVRHEVEVPAAEEQEQMEVADDNSAGFHTPPSHSRISQVETPDCPSAYRPTSPLWMPLAAGRALVFDDESPSTSVPRKPFRGSKLDFTDPDDTLIKMEESDIDDDEKENVSVNKFLRWLPKGTK